MLLQTFLSKQPSDTLDSSMTFDFSVSVGISNFLFIIGLFECFCGWGRPIRFCEGFRFVFPRFCHWWDVKLQGGISFIFRGFRFHLCLMDFKLTSFIYLLLLLLFYFFLFAYRMARGYEEVSNSQARCQRGTPWETPTITSLVVAVSAEELRFYNQVPTEIILEMLDGLTASTVKEADNATYFTQELFVAGLHFPVSSFVKQFLHFTLAPPALVHLNVFFYSNGL